jgi:hypothetical protein
MSHWAEIDKNSIVVRITVGDNNEPDEGYQWLIDNLSGTWIKTSYNGNIRKNFAGIGFLYDPIRDAFIPPKPENIDGIEFILNEDTCLWELPESGA